MRSKRRKLGVGKGPYIIAEIGSNFETLDEAIRSIGIARDCGADAAKFQLHSPSALYGFCGGTDAYSLPFDWLPKLKEKADACGIDLGITAFSPELVAVVDPFVPWHKVASSDCTWPQLLDAVAATGKPVLLSSGAKTNREMKKAWTRVKRRKRSGVVRFLKCTAAYPADFIDLSEVGGYYDGLSDHTLGYTAAVEAAGRGATVIEKHFTAFPDFNTPDRPHSLTPVQFKRMVDIIRGNPFESEEKAMYLRHNRRLIATRDIAIGDTLEYGVNFGAYRSLKDDSRGLSPYAWSLVNRKAAKVAIKRGESIGPGDF